MDMTVALLFSYIDRSPIEFKLGHQNQKTSPPTSSATTYLLDKSYQETANGEAIKAFQEKCGTFVSNWH
jgi:hypothetical protein